MGFAPHDWKNSVSLRCPSKNLIKCCWESCFEIYVLFFAMIVKRLQRERLFFSAGMRDAEKEQQEQQQTERHAYISLDLTTRRAHTHSRMQRTQTRNTHETRLLGWGSQANSPPKPFWTRRQHEINNRQFFPTVSVKVVWFSLSRS